jgi:hypothetical protein
MNDKNKLKKKLKTIQKAFEAYSKRRIVVDEIPDDWFSREDYQIANDISEAHAVRHIKVLVTSGKVEKKSFHKTNISGNYRLIPHYRLKD